MPNASGPHGAKNPKNRGLPTTLTKADIIGYTPPQPGKPRPTVYFTSGHLTIWHPDDWNIGWDSCEGWIPLFFGNVLKKDYEAGKDSSHDAKHRSPGNPKGNIPPPDYIAKLKALGHNRVTGAKPNLLRNWDLQTRDETDRILREFWIRASSPPSSSSPSSPRGAAGPSSPRGAGTTPQPDMLDMNRFAHPSRGPFIPVPVNATDCRDELWKLVEAYKKSPPKVPPALQTELKKCF